MLSMAFLFLLVHGSNLTMDHFPRGWKMIIVMKKGAAEDQIALREKTQVLP
jgi:hypothetical protein